MTKFKIQYYLKIEEILETDNLLYDVHRVARHKMITLNDGDLKNGKAFLYSIEEIKEDIKEHEHHKYRPSISK